MEQTKPRIGVALCAAELAGTAHVGILQGLADIGIDPYHISGSSSGSLIASLYGHGYSRDEFSQVISKFPGIFLFDYGFPLVSSLANVIRHSWEKEGLPIPHGLVRGSRLRKYIAKLHKGRLPRRRYSIVATDLYTTDAVVFSNDPECIQTGHACASMDVINEIAGSCAIPGIFTPVRYKQWLLVDGGVRDVVPVSFLRKAKCDKIIAINVHLLPDSWRPITTVDILTRSLATVLNESDASELAAADVFVLRPELEMVSWLSGRKAMQTNVERGYQYVQDMRNDILHFLGQ